MKTIKLESITIGVVDSQTVFNDVRDVLDMMSTFAYFEESSSLGMIVCRQSLGDKFFDLKSGYAGEVLQKFSNYKIRLAIVGNFGNEKSKSLRDFIRECNRGSGVFFVDSEQAAIERLATAT